MPGDAGLAIAFTADTHTHADYISGSPELAADGATFLAPAAARLAHPYTGVRDGDVIAVGRFRLEAIATPGHTPTTSPTCSGRRAVRSRSSPGGR